MRKVIFALLAALSCGGGGDQTPTNPNGGGNIGGGGGGSGPGTLTLAKVSGDNQHVALGATTPDSLVVKVTGSSTGAGVSGVNVSWSASGGATVEPATSVTNAAGEARAVLRVPNAVATVGATATIQGGTQSFQATTAAAAAIRAISGGSQSGAANVTLTEAFVIEVADASGKPLGGANVQFVTGGEGTFVDAAPVAALGGSVTQVLNRATGSDGRASGRYRFGANAGIYQAAARFFSGPQTVLAGTRFTATGPNPAFVATVGVGQGPQGVAVDRITNKVYVGNNGTFFGCSDMATGASVESSTITVIDGATNAATTVPAGGGSPIYAVPNPNTGKVYVATSSPTGVTILNGATLTQISRISEAGSHQPAINLVANEIWTNTRRGPAATYALSLISGTTDQLVQYVDLPGGVHGVAVSSARNEVYASRVDTDGLIIVDGATRSIAQVLSLTHSLAVAFNPLTNRIYVSSGNFGEVHVIDAVSRTRLTTININAHAIEMAVDEARNRIYAASMSSPYSIVVIDGATNTVRGKVPVGGCPFGVAYNPTNDRIYVSNGHDHTVTVLDASKIPF